MHEAIGIIVGEASSTSFIFSSTTERCPSRLDYVSIQSMELIDGVLTEVDVLAQVEAIFSASDALSQYIGFEAIRRIKAADIDDIRVYGKARILGYMQDDERDALFPRRSITPGSEVRLASESLLERFYSFEADEALDVGSLITRRSVNVSISVTGLRRHMAIIAQTGAGKSYAAGVILEELLEKGATVLIIDPHADYVLMGRNEDASIHELSDRCKVFRNPSSTGRYEESQIGTIEEYTIAFSDLSDDEVFEIAGVAPSYRRIRETMSKVLGELRQSNSAYTPDDLLDTLLGHMETAATQGERSDYASAVRFARDLVRMRVFGGSSTQLSRLLAPMQLSTLDLSGLDHSSMDYIVAKLLREVYEEVSSGRFPHPVFVLVEEAHNFVSRENSTMSSSILKRIAAEGRKFGVFLIVVTQRPSKIHADTLSQCNSQIIMKLTNPKDQNSVAESSERLSSDLLADLPGLNPGEAVIVGPIAKAPVMVKIRRRRTREGGADIDIVSALRSARKEVGIDKVVAKHKESQEKFGGAFEDE
ncbi:MAG: ATP-binding protein [Candidatus Thorarchaeota archaeon]|nr:ATP-binding protein [Candidatus Thorarchaeota archaeon]